MRVIRLSLCLLLISLIAGCTKSTTTGSRETEIKKKLDSIVHLKTKGDLLLPSAINDYDNVIISWESSDPEILSNQGKVAIVNAESTVKLTCKVEFLDNDQTFNYEYNVKVLPNLNEINYINECYDSLMFKTKKQVRTEKLNLAEDSEIYTDVKFSWSSLTPNLINDEGKVLVNHLNDIDVVMRLVVTYGDIRRMHDVPFKILGAVDTEKVVLVKEWLIELMANTDFTQTFQLPITDQMQFDSEIAWVDSAGGIVDFYGKISKTLVSKKTTLTAEIRIGTASIKTDFAYTSIALNSSEIESYMLNFIDDIFNVHATSDVVNLIDGKPLDILDGMIQLTNNSKVRGLRSKPSAEALKKAGYTAVPNDSNVLWITIHETGNANPGTDAKMHNQLIQKIGDTSTSWHYSIDQDVVYQHIPDNYGANHAGETMGNNWAIGIEMCVNPDGNYEGSMRHDAKLVAYLLKKHNLDLKSVQQHYYFSGKNCPEIMRTTGRWFEFLGMVDNERKILEMKEHGLEVSYSYNLGSNQVLSAVPSLIYWDKKDKTLKTLTVEAEIKYNGKTTKKNYSIQMGKN